MRHTRIDPDISRILKALALSCILYGSLLFIVLIRPFPLFFETHQSPATESPRSLSVRLTLVYPEKKVGISTPVLTNKSKNVRNSSIEIIQRSFVSEEGQQSSFEQGVPSINEGMFPIEGINSVTISTHDAFVSWLDGEIKHKRIYPERARRRNIEGTVTLLLTVSSDGKCCIPLVTESSGSALLDKAALALILSLFPAPISPGKEFADSIKIQYLLRQD